MFGKSKSDVLVVGAGPTGMFAALRLAQAGAKPRLIDKHWRPGAHSYALAIHPRSIELLEAAGVAGPLVERGRRVTRVGFWENGHRRGEVRFDALDARHPFALVLPQSVLEGELEHRLGELKVEIAWNHRLEGLRENGGELVAEIARLDQVAAGYPISRSEWTVVKTTREATPYILGTDGYHSQVRERLGIRFEQFGPLATFSVFEFESEEDPGDELRVYFDGNLTSAFWPMPGRRCRFSFQISHPNQHEPSLGRLNEFIKARAPGFPAARGDLLWSSMVQFDRRLAVGLGRDRIWLAGDSTHLTSPVGVQSMNAGLVDADQITARLAAAVGGRGGAAFEGYEAARLAELRKIFGPTDLFPPPASAPDWARTLWPRIVSSIPATGAELDALLGQLGS